MLERQQGNEEDEQRTEDGLSFTASFTVLLLSRYGDLREVAECSRASACNRTSYLQSVLSVDRRWH